MGSIRNTFYYCCIWNNGKVLYAYNNGVDQEIDNLAALCLQKAPPHHKWYFQTMSNKTFGFLMEDKFIYFTIIDENIGNPKNLEFLGNFRDEFKKISKKSSKLSNSAALHDKLTPVLRRLIDTVLASYNDGLSPSPVSSDVVGSTKAPLLGKPSKHEKRKMRDHVISVAENGPGEEHRKSADKTGSKEGLSVSKEVSVVSRPGNQTIRHKWRRQVRIVLAVDVAVCLVLFVVWLVVCRGTQCLR